MREPDDLKFDRAEAERYYLDSRIKAGKQGLLVAYDEELSLHWNDPIIRNKHFNDRLIIATNLTNRKFKFPIRGVDESDYV